VRELRKNKILKVNGGRVFMRTEVGFEADLPGCRGALEEACQASPRFAR
jgi:hypothetical protein